MVGQNLGAALRREIVGRQVVFDGEGEFGSAVAGIDVEGRGILAVDEVVEAAPRAPLSLRVRANEPGGLRVGCEMSYLSKSGRAARDSGRHVGLRTIELVEVLDRRGSLRSRNWRFRALAGPTSDYTSRAVQPTYTSRDRWAGQNNVLKNILGIPLINASLNIRQTVRSS